MILATYFRRQAWVAFRGIGLKPGWLQRLKRVFKIDILACEHCGGAVKVIASIEDPVVIKTILDHLARQAEAATPVSRPFARAPPQQKLPGLTQPG